MYEDIIGVIGKVKATPSGWNIALMPDCTTWLTLHKSETKIGEPRPGDTVRIQVPRILDHCRA
jgi:hypothetical protein